jgi:hypothetical protein
MQESYNRQKGRAVAPGALKDRAAAMFSATWGILAGYANNGEGF